MFRVACLLAASAVSLSLLPAPASAQLDPATLSIIGKLKPNQPTGLRGIRVPGSEPAAGAVPQQPAPPSLTAAPQAPAAGAPATPRPQVAASRPPAMPANTSAATTAPAGVPAIAMTIEFATGSATLTPAAERTLAPLGRALASNDLSAYRFRIEGHTDTVGSVDLNMALSQQRADAVKAYLMQGFNIPASRLETVGLGKSQVLVRTGDNVSEQRNRRVQVLNIGS